MTRKKPAAGKQAALREAKTSVQDPVWAKDQRQQEQEEQNREQRESRVAPVARYWEQSLYEPKPMTPEEYPAWLDGWAKRLVEFGRRLNDSGYSERVQDLESSEPAEQFAIELIQAGMSGSVNKVRKLLDTRGIDWLQFFRTDELRCRMTGDGPVNPPESIASQGTIEEPKYKAILSDVQEVRSGLEKVKWYLKRNNLDSADIGLLEAMKTRGAVSADTLTNHDRIAEEAIDGYATAIDVKRRMSSLVKAGFVASKPGRSGGCWLTELGLEMVRISSTE